MIEVLDCPLNIDEDCRVCGLFALHPAIYFGVHVERFRIIKTGGRYQFPPVEQRLEWRDKMWSNISEIVRVDMRKQRRLNTIRRVFTDEFVEDVVEPYVGYKFLTVRFNGATPSLYSSQRETLWPVEGLVATCSNLMVVPEGLSTHDPEHIPWPDCSCGIYAYKRTAQEFIMTVRSMSIAGSGSRMTEPFEGPIVARVALGGFVIPHSDGYLAQIAKITGIYYPYNPHIDFHTFAKIRATFKQIVEHYQVPVLEELDG